MTEGTATSSLFEATRLGLSRIALGHADELSRALERTCRASAQALLVERVGIWFISSDASEIRCACLFELSLDKATAGATLSLSLLPGYVEALEQKRVLPMPGPAEATQSAALREEYLVPLDIRATLEAPIFRDGDVVGVVRLEHTGSPREWSSRDRHFAGSIADLVAVLLEQATRLDLEAALAAQRERLVKAEKMEALSRMSAGVAHDFNNVLTAIMLRADALRVEHQDNGDIDSALREILEAGERGARLVQQLLTFAKARLPAPRPVDLARTLREMEPMLQTLVRGRARLTIEPVRAPVLVSVDPSQIEQVILNLVVNARDAGTRSESEVCVRLVADEEAILLSVADQGAGMDAATREQVFEPFFTTKAHGSGLGLSTVYSIVQQAGGSVSVESTEGTGSTFSVRLPLIQ